MDRAKRLELTTWPSRTPDFNPIDFCFWGHLKSVVYPIATKSKEELFPTISPSGDQISVEHFKKAITIDRNFCFLFLYIYHSGNTQLR